MERHDGVRENAYSELEPGQIYKPIVPSEVIKAEVTRWAISLGILMTVIFTAAAAYISLRTGNGIEASVPIALLAIFFGKMRGSTILENVMVQSVGQASGVVAAGATFVVPALYINGLEPTWWQIALACTIGGCLGVVLTIPLRRYFVKEQHGKYPFPEGKAIHEVLVTGQSSASGGAKILLLSFLLGFGFDFLLDVAHVWNAELTTSVLPGGVGEWLSGHRLELSASAMAALFGMGFLIGPKYAAIITAGSVLASLIMVPLAYLFGSQVETFHYVGKDFDISSMSAGKIFSVFIKPIGIGAIAISGLITIIRMWKIVASSVTMGFKGLSKSGGVAVERTDQDMSPRNVLLIQVGTTLAMGILFFVVAKITPQDTGGSYNIQQSLIFAGVGMGVGFVLSFLFTPVAIQAIAIMGVNPVSGMTLVAVVLAIGSMVLVGLGGKAGMIVALIVGTAICTALSTSGAFISDLKVGYWIGSTPRNQQRWKFLGIVIAALVVAFVIPLMNEAYHFTILDSATGALIPNDKVLPAPQSNMIAAVARGLMDDPANQPWLGYGLGGFIAVMSLLCGIPGLAFALGMYLPMAINLPVFLGAACAWLIGKTGRTDRVRKARMAQGDLIASGLVAGAAILGICAAVLRLPDTGAPIRHISVGVNYRLEAVVNGSAVMSDDMPDKPVESCDGVELDGKACNQQLVELSDELDESGRPVLDENGKPKPAHPWYTDGTGHAVGLGMLILLGLACYGLSRLGARWSLKAEADQDSDIA